MILKFSISISLLLMSTIVFGQFDTNGFAEFKMDQIGTKKTNKTTTTTAIDYHKHMEEHDSVFMLIENGQKYLLHTVEAGQTVYSIKKFYGIDFSDIYYSNPSLKINAMKIGQQIKIPIVDKALKYFENGNFVDTAFIPVFYKVRPSETLFRLSRMYFRIPADLIMARNGLHSDVLSVGQVLHIGWLDKRGIPDTLKQYTGLPASLEADNRIHKYRYEAKLAAGKKEQNSAGIACWDKSMRLSSTNKLYVMSSLVPSGGVVRIENPMTNRFLYAKVVAPKPENSFTDDAIIMLTPTVANALGGLDSRFYVKVLYCK